MEKLIRLSPVFLFVFFCIKVLILGGSWIDASIVVVLSSLSFFHEYISKLNEVNKLRKETDDKFIQIKADIEKNRSEFEKHNHTIAEKQAIIETNLAEVKVYLNNLKVTQSFKKM